MRVLCSLSLSLTPDLPDFTPHLVCVLPAGAAVSASLLRAECALMLGGACSQVAGSCYGTEARQVSGCGSCGEAAPAAASAQTAAGIGGRVRGKGGGIAGGRGRTDRGCWCQVARGRQSTKAWARALIIFEGRYVCIWRDSMYGDTWAVTRALAGA